MSEIPTPGGEVAGWRQYAPRVDGSNQMIGFTDPDGNYHTLDEGQELAFIKSPRGEGREPFIKDKDGKLTPLNPAVANGEQSAAAAEGGIPINRNALNGIVRETTQKGALFGVDYNLDDEGRKQVKLVVDASEQIIEEKKQDPLWIQLQDIIKKLADKGEIMSFEFPPSWLVDGGNIARVEVKYGDNNLPKIHAPSEIYHLYVWNGVLKDVKRYIDSTELKGQSAAGFGKGLGQLAHLLRKFGKIS